MNDVAKILASAIRDAQPDGETQLRMATVTAFTTGGVTVQFDGEASASTREYKRLEDGQLGVGERAVMLRAGTTWLCIGAIHGAALGPSANVNAGANVTLNGTKVHRRGGFAELQIEQLTATAALAAGAILLGVTSNDYLPASNGLMRGTLTNFTTGGTVLVQILANGTLQTATAVANGNQLYGSLVYPLA